MKARRLESVLRRRSEYAGPIQHLYVDHFTPKEAGGWAPRSLTNRHDGVRLRRGAHQGGALIRKRPHEKSFCLGMETSEDEVAAVRTRVQFSVEPGAQFR